MGILEKDRPLLVTLHTVREARYDITEEAAGRIEWFYAHLLGLPPWPAKFQFPGGLGFGPPRKGLRLDFRHDPQVDHLKPRLVIIVPSLDEFERRLLEAECPFQRRRGFSWSEDHLRLLDPIGHIIEARQFRAF